MIRLSKYIDPEVIEFLTVETRDEAISQLVDALANTKKLSKNKNEFHQAVTEREKVVTTGIGMGVAIPHAKLACYNDFFLAIGILSKGIDWGALDGTAVRLIFMIGGPDDKQTEYLQILSNLTLALKDEDRRKKLLAAKSPETVVKLFKDF